jgi:uncharacterized protein YndB with AHSA1/START domain
MIKFLLITALVIVVVIICVLIVAATKPARFTVHRSITVQAPPDKVFALINDLHRWPEWSADERNDSTVRRSYSGASAGQGAVCEWEGAGSVGKGRIEIIESSPTRIRLQADWAKPFAARNINLFTLEPQGNATRVTWALDGEDIFMLKVMTVFVSADRLMGSHFESGLASLKTVAEK